MNGVPDDLDLASFVGTTLDVISVAKYQLSFGFSGDSRTEKDRVIAVEGHWELRDAQSAVIDKATENDHRDVYRIHRLLSHTVAGTKVNPPESFTLVFDNDWTLTFLDNSSQYECCHVYVGDMEIHI